MLKYYFNPRLKIFSLSSNRPLAEKIVDAVGTGLGKYSVTQFSDDEIQVNIEESIRGTRAYVIQSTSSPVNDNPMELLIMINVSEHANVKTINMVILYYGYVRQDHKACARGPITAKLVASMIEEADAIRMLILDLHAVQIQGFFDTPVGHLMGTPLIVDRFIKYGIQGDDVVVVSPSHGDVMHARKLAEFLKAPIAVIDKRRPKANVAEVTSIIGHVGGKTYALIDDMIDTAGIISPAANTSKGAGAKDVHASCIYPALSGPALQRIEDSVVEHLVVTDSIYLPDDCKTAKIDEVSVGELIGDTIKYIRENKPVSPLFEAKSRQL